MLTPTKIFQHYYFLEHTWLRYLIFVLEHQIVHNVCFGWYSSVSIKHILVWKINCLNYYFHAIFIKSVIVRSNSTTTSVCLAVCLSFHIFSEGYRRYLALGFTSFVRASLFLRFCFFCLNDQGYNCLIHFYKKGISIHHHASCITQRRQP